jgi:hypothetical protein
MKIYICCLSFLLLNGVLSYCQCNVEIIVPVVTPIVSGYNCLVPNEYIGFDHIYAGSSYLNPAPDGVKGDCFNGPNEMDIVTSTAFIAKRYIKISNNFLAVGSPCVGRIGCAGDFYAYIDPASCKDDNGCAVDSITGPSLICGGDNSNPVFVDYTSGGTWSCNDPDVSIDPNTGVVGASANATPGTATITYTVGGCSVSKTIQVSSDNLSMSVSSLSSTLDAFYLSGTPGATVNCVFFNTNNNQIGSYQVQIPITLSSPANSSLANPFRALPSGTFSIDAILVAPEGAPCVENTEVTGSLLQPSHRPGKNGGKDTSLNSNNIASYVAPSNDPVLGFNLFPNPATSYVNITSIGTLTYPITVNLKDISGRVIFTQGYSGDIQLDLSLYSSGFYIAEIQTGSGLFTYKVTKY